MWLLRWRRVGHSGGEWAEGLALPLVSHLVGSDNPKEWLPWAGLSPLHLLPCQACLSGHVVWCPSALIPGPLPLVNSPCPIPGDTGQRWGTVSVRTVTSPPRVGQESQSWTLPPPPSRTEPGREAARPAEPQIAQMPVPAAPALQGLSLGPGGHCPLDPLSKGQGTAAHWLRPPVEGLWPMRLRRQALGRRLGVWGPITNRWACAGILKRPQKALGCAL